MAMINPVIKESVDQARATLTTLEFEAMELDPPPNVVAKVRNGVFMLREALALYQTVNEGK